MKLNAQMIIGTLLILWGISIFIKLIFNISIPVVMPAIGMFLIYLGISFLLNPEYVNVYKRKVYTYTVHDEDSKR